ncbi:MAG: dihydroorotate dehydrogenase-like protein [Bacteroidales bacterium]|jgi:dihydroorotate dehydrogenase (fumarate)|nr:dihydroorotate dehydrogenase-like protein [Bacteroidales bacterium]
MNTVTEFMGLKINSPIVIGSCGLTADVEELIKFEAAGAGAIILKSIFEEQILNETSNNVRNQEFFNFPDSYDYIMNYSQTHAVEKYLNLIRDAKQKIQIPVIASVNCISNSEWLNFAVKMQNAGADGIELNMFILPADVNLTTEDIERFYEETIHIIRRAITIPVSIKISHYFTSLTRFVQKISLMGIANINIFNRFMMMDIDIENLKTKPAKITSEPSEIYDTIRWTAILSKAVRCGLTSGGGVHNEADVVKLLLAGANAVQVVSHIYNEGCNFITKSNQFLLQYMERHNYNSIEKFRGLMSLKNNQPSDFLRVQFMKYFANIK